MYAPKRILHPTDFSPCSEYALHIASDLATVHQARLLILHVVESLGPENATFGEVATELQPTGYRERILTDLRKIRPSVGPEIPVDYLLAEGDPASGIERTAQEQHCDLIVMGTHGYRGLRHLMLGSVAERVVQRSPCDVLVVKPCEKQHKHVGPPPAK